MWFETRPLSPILFLIDAKGLSVMFKEAEHMGLFHVFKLGEDHISHPQFVDDTLIIRENICDNVWAINAILQSFEATSNLKVNFAKSHLMGINVEDDWLRQTVGLLNC